MKLLIAFIVTVLLAITVLVCLVEVEDNGVETKETIGFNVQGQVGTKLDKNVCLNPNNGKVEFCL